MKRFIRLADLDGMEVPNARYSDELTAKARASLVRRNLRFDNSTGVLRDNTYIHERFVNPSDHVPATSEEEVMRWQFSRYINNSASRISRGYKP